jgi:hypothetical protein
MGMATTHALETVFALYFLAGLWVALAATRAPADVHRRMAVVMGSSLAALGLFRLAHHALVGHVVQYEQRRAMVTGATILRMLGGRDHGLLGGVPPEASYLFGPAASVAVYSVFPALLLPALLALDRRMAPLWGTLALPLLAYSTPLSFAVLLLLTTNEITFATGYFAPLGLIAFLALAYRAMGEVRARVPLPAVIRPTTLRYGVAVLLAALAGALFVLPASWGLARLAVARPTLPALLGTAGGVLVLARRPLRARSESGRVPWWAFLAMLLPVFIGFKRFPGVISGSDRASAWRQVWRNRTPSVTDWAA